MSASNKLKLELMVASWTNMDDRVRLIQQILALHATQSESEIEILTWDGESFPHTGVTKKMRRYAAIEVATAQTTGPAASAWAANWGQIAQTRVRSKLMRGTKWLPMYLCYTGRIDEMS